MSNEELIKEIDNPNIYNIVEKLVALNDYQLRYNEKILLITNFLKEE